MLLLAPMEGLLDDVLRAVLTRVGGYDHAVTEFVRVSGTLLPDRYFRRIAPELDAGSRTGAGVPVRVQLLGSDPACMAANAERLARLKPAGVDLNFGCPAPTVNRHRGGAVLLDEPELLHRIAAALAAVLPPDLPLTAKMRLGVADPGRARECALALVEGGVHGLVVHARTKVQGYKPPAHWEWIARVQEAVAVPVYANGDIWSLADWQRCREVSGAEHIMLGRGLVSCPDLARQIAAARRGGRQEPMDWAAIRPLLIDFWQQARGKIAPRYAPGRLKQWLALLTRNYPEAVALFAELRRENDCARIDALLGVDTRERRAAAQA